MRYYRVCTRVMKWLSSRKRIFRKCTKMQLHSTGVIFSQVGHHGSKNSTMTEFLSAVASQVTIIYAGEENPSGHPSPELLQRLEESGVRVLRTDHDGAVQIRTDGHNLQVRCFNSCPETGNQLGSAQPPDHNQHQ